MLIKFPGVTHRRHSIKTLKSGDEWQARAFRGKTEIGEVVTTSTDESAILIVKRQLDETAARQRAMRGADGFPTVDEVRAALPHLKFNRAQEAMLAAHVEAPNHVLTATQLAEAAGYGDYVVANSQYGQLGRALAEELDWEPPMRKDGNPIWTLTLATDADGSAREEGEEVSGHWRWKLRPEIVSAMASQ